MSKIFNNLNNLSLRELNKLEKKLQEAKKAVRKQQKKALKYAVDRSAKLIKAYDTRKSMDKRYVDKTDKNIMDLNLNIDLDLSKKYKPKKQIKTVENFKYDATIRNKRDGIFHMDWERDHERINNKPTVGQIVDSDRKDFEILINDSELEVIGFDLVDRVVLSKEKMAKLYKPFKKRTVKSVIPIKYLFTKADDINIPTEDGLCLTEGLVRLYKKYIPSLTVEKVNDILNDYHRRNCKDDECSIYHIVEHIQGFSDRYKVSRIGLDVLNNIQDRQVYNRSFIRYTVL